MGSPLQKSSLNGSANNRVRRPVFRWPQRCLPSLNTFVETGFDETIGRYFLQAAAIRQDNIICSEMPLLMEYVSGSRDSLVLHLSLADLSSSSPKMPL